MESSHSVSEKHHTASFFKPFFKDYEHQFKIIKSTYEREKSNTSSPTLIINILRVFDKDINRCIKSIEELFKHNESKYRFAITTEEIEKKILHQLIPEFIAEKKTDFTFEQVTLCLHFLFQFLHKIKKVPEYFTQDCVLLILTLTLQESLSKKSAMNKQVEKKYLFDLAVIILVSLKFSISKTSRKKMLKESLADFDLAGLYCKYKDDFQMNVNPTTNSFLFIDNSPIAKEKRKKYKFEKLILKMLKLITGRYKIVDQQSNYHKDFMNSLFDFTLICLSNNFYDISEKKNPEICIFELKNTISIQSLNKINYRLLKVFNQINLSKFIGLFSNEKLSSYLKSSLSIILFNILHRFVYEDNGNNENIVIDLLRIKTFEDKEKIEKILATKKNYYDFEIVTKEEANNLKNENKGEKKVFLIKDDNLSSMKAEFCFHVRNFILFLRKKWIYFFKFILKTLAEIFLQLKMDKDLEEILAKFLILFFKRVIFFFLIYN